MADIGCAVAGMITSLVSMVIVVVVFVVVFSYSPETKSATPKEEVWLQTEYQGASGWVAASQVQK
ncbi:MAG: hypothetical protein IJJ13_07415 [Lachnospiraceae bacterium]|nr:hypothetical protein [Lachnospiraceae bacterium]